MSWGSRKLLPVKRRMVARSMRRSTVATAWASDGKELAQFEKPVLAVITMEPCRCLAEGIESSFLAGWNTRATGFSEMPGETGLC